MSATAGHDSVELWSGKDRRQENFPVAALVRPGLRRHVHAFYDFARNADDIADNPALAADDKLARLDTMEAVLTGARGRGDNDRGDNDRGDNDRCDNDRGSRDRGSPSALGLRQSLAETGLPDIHARELLLAFRQDATKHRYASWDELYDYCRYSAMPVGRHVLALHGESTETWPASDALCSVLQVLNHLQDCAKDLAQLDRCYLPADMLADAGASLADLRGPAETAGLRRVFARLLDRCDALNAAGRALPSGVRDWRLRLETAVIVTLSHRLARRLRQGDPIATRVKLRPADVLLSAVLSLRHLPGPAAPAISA